MDLTKLMAYLKYLPTILAIAKGVADVVEVTADSSHTGAEKEAAAVSTIQAALNEGNVHVADDVVSFAIHIVIGISNSLRSYTYQKLKA